jgi:lysophospholipase L1-like esterase
VSITIGGRNITAIFAGDRPIREVRHGDTLVWASGPETLHMDFGWERARTEPYRIMFMGSSTTEGYGTTRNESFVTQFIAAICKQTVGAPASRPVKQNSGTVTAPTAPGFHFLNAGVGGTNTGDYYGPDRGRLLSGWNPTLVFHMIGSNDYSRQTPLAEVTYNLNDIMTDANPRTSGRARHVFIHSYRREDVDDDAVSIKWADYGRTFREFCDSRDDCEFLDAGAWFDHLRVDGRDYLQSDRVHALWTGNTLLTDAVTAGLRFEDHEDALIFGMDALSWPHLSDGTAMSSFQPLDGSMMVTSMRGTGDQRPTFRNRDGVMSLDFRNGQKRMETAAWPGVHSLPITFYAVTSTLGAAGTNSQPFFTRSVAGDDGYLWAWRERDSNLIKGASNTAFNAGAALSRADAEKPVVIAVSFLPSGHMRFYINGVESTSTAIDRPTENNSPWMRSLKLGTNTGNSDFAEMDVREMRWHHGMDVATVQDRIRGLAEKHHVQIVSEVTDWFEVTESTVLDAPRLAAWADIVVLGAGSGGGAAGGAPGEWFFTTWFMQPGRSLDITIGEGGRGSMEDNQPGGDTFVVPSDVDWRVTGEGGAGAGGTGGVGAPGYTVFGHRFEGSEDAGAGQPGGVPGGGGGPYRGGTPGGDGGRGTVWVRWHLYNHRPRQVTVKVAQYGSIIENSHAGDTDLVDSYVPVQYLGDHAASLTADVTTTVEMMEIAADGNIGSGRYPAGTTIPAGTHIIYNYSRTGISTLTFTEV